MKIIIAAGGTAGHIFPALALAQELRDQGHEVFFIGVFKDNVERIQRAGYRFEEIGAQGLRTDEMMPFLKSSVLMLKATVKSFNILSKNKPQKIIGFGGYGAFPVVLAGLILKIPTMIHEQNVLPGRANRLLTCAVSKIAVSFEKGLNYFPAHKTVWTGYPSLRENNGIPKADIASAWGLDPHKKTILVLGGSQGSHAVNEIFLDALDLLKDIPSYQVIHTTGKKDHDFVKDRYARMEIQHYVTSFLEEMEKAYCMADLIISRAGAGTITEIAMFQKPCILIPYPYAQQHQRENAAILFEAGNASILDEKDLYPAQMRDAIIRFLNEFSLNETSMSSLKRIGIADATQRLAREVLDL